MLVPCMSGKTKLVWAQFIRVIQCYPERGAVIWTQACECPVTTLCKAPGAGSCYKQYPGIGVTLEASPRATAAADSGVGTSYKASLGWILDWAPSSASLNALLAAWTLLCCWFGLTLGVDPKPLTSWSLLVPGKHGGPPRSSDYLLPPSPESCSPVAPAPLTLLAVPCLALQVSLCTPNLSSQPSAAFPDCWSVRPFFHFQITTGKERTTLYYCLVYTRGSLNTSNWGIMNNGC